MSVYTIKPIQEWTAGNPYVGRGIVVGRSADGRKACIAYFIMGRSANSRNRIFTEREDGLYTEPYDSSKVEDPSLIIYAALRRYQNHLIVTNGDQTDTVYEGLQKGLGFAEALAAREFEPDAPNFTPRISAMLTFADGDFTYEMSILKSIDAEGSGCCRYTYSYPSRAGLGHFIHTYEGDGNPLPTFQGEPQRTAIPDDIDEFTKALWDSLDKENRISLYVCYRDLTDGHETKRRINKNEGE